MNSSREESCAVGGAPYATSRAARAGYQLIRLAGLVSALRPAIVFGATALLCLVTAAHPGAAQSLLNGNSQQPVNSLRTLVNIGVWALVAFGLGGIAWGIVNGMRMKAWGAQIGWGGAALGFSGIVALVNSVVNDDPVDLPEW
jgi:hypothetical protein